MKNYSMQLTRTSSATPEAVYDFLADLESHLTWGGSQQRRDFRLLSLAGPTGPATTGTVFTSTGSIPMSVRHFEDRSEVTVAERPHTFEFVTRATVHRGEHSMTAKYLHRYEIAEAPGGSRVTYTMTQLDAANPFLRLGVPLVRDMTWRMAMPFMAGRGFRNLLTAAEQRGTQRARTAAAE